MCVSGGRPLRLSEARRSTTFARGIDEPTLSVASPESHQAFSFATCSQETVTRDCPKPVYRQHSRVLSSVVIRYVQSGARPESLPEARRSTTFARAIDKPTLHDERVESDQVSSLSYVQSGARHERLPEARRSTTFARAIDKPTLSVASPESHQAFSFATCSQEPVTRDCPKPVDRPHSRELSTNQPDCTRGNKATVRSRSR